MEIFTPLFWLIVGIALMLLEIAAPGFILFFFGIGGLITALAALLGIESISLQMTIFIVTSLVTLIIFRKKFKNIFRGEYKLATKSGDEQFSDYVGKRAEVIEEINPNGLGGKVEFRGTLWNASSDGFIAKGKIVEIISRDNLNLKVKEVPEENNSNL